MPRPRVFTDDEIADALRIGHGLLATAAQLLNKTGGGRKITRQALTYRLKKSAALREAAEQADEAMIDFAEQELYKLIKAGDRSAIIFYLKCKGKARGYIERQELTGKDGAALAGGKLEPVDINIKLIRPDAEKGEALEI